MEKKIKEINMHLEKIGSLFRTSDGLTLVRYNGKLVFLKKTFNTVEDCYNFVMSIK